MDGVIAWSTFQPDGSPTATYTTALDGSITAITVVTDQAFVLEGEYNETSFSDNTTLGTNKFPVHLLTIKFAGRSEALNEQIKYIDLGKHTFLIKSGEKAVLLGREFGMTASQSNSGSGAKAEDFFGYDIQVSGPQLEKARVVALSVYNAVLADTDQTDPAQG